MQEWKSVYLLSRGSFKNSVRSIFASPFFVARTPPSPFFPNGMELGCSLPLARFRNHAICIYSKKLYVKVPIFLKQIKTASAWPRGSAQDQPLTFGQVWGPFDSLPPSMTLTCLSRPTKNSMRCLSRVIKKKTIYYPLLI